jgi:hypothetical protein
VAGYVSESESRRVAEEAREREWRLPSFGRELFLGKLRLDLIHPQPPLDPQAVQEGQRFLGRLRTFLEREVDALEIEPDARIPQRMIVGLKELGAMGMKIEEQYGGLGLSQVYYNQALALSGSARASLSTLLSAYQSIGVSEPLRLFGSDGRSRSGCRSWRGITSLPSYSPSLTSALTPRVWPVLPSRPRTAPATSSTAASSGPPTERSPTWSW